MSAFQIVLMIPVDGDTGRGAAVFCMPTNYLSCNNFEKCTLKIYTNL